MTVAGGKDVNSEGEARSLLQGSDFVWHQRFQLAPGVFTPGVNDIEWLLDRLGLPEDLSGATVLDIGTTNGGLAFAVERRKAARVVAVDIFPPSWFGFDRLSAFLGSRVEFVQASVYELPMLMREKFDIVCFLGVIYHLRHPFLGLDAVRALTGDVAFIESEVLDDKLPGQRHLPIAYFYRRDELAGDSSNWFAPTITALLEWCGSCGFDAELLDAMPSDVPRRALVRARPTSQPPEYLALSYERPIQVTVPEPAERRA